MNKDKQIEEMARIIDDNDGFIVSSVETAEALYAKGYRKTSEVAREILEEIIEALTAERIEENRKANSALEAQDTASYEVYNYAEDKLDTLVTALSIYKKKYAEVANDTK